MNIWNCDNWKKVYKGNNIRNGLRLRFDVNVDKEVKLALKDFTKHLRKEYSFPYRVNVYVKSKMKIKAIDGELVDGTFGGPYDKLEEPFIRISVGDYCKEKIKRGRRNVLISYCHVMAHELTHYFQWINQIKLTEIGEERQAKEYADIIVGDYIYKKNKEKYDLLEKIEKNIEERNFNEYELQVLDKLSWDEENGIREKVAEMLIHSDTDKGVKILLRLTGDNDSSVRAEACDSLCIGKTLVEYETLKKIAQIDKADNVRGYAIRSLEDVARRLHKENELVEFLEGKIKNKEKPFIKICIYTSLYVIGKENYLYNLLEMINEKNYINRISVINSLDYIASENNKDEILRVLKERRSNENKRIVISSIEELINDLKNDLFWDREL